MSSLLQILQVIVSLIAVAALCYFNALALMAACKLLFKDRRAAIALSVFAIGFILAAVLQRARVGFWDWPDVEYQVEQVEDESADE